MTPQSCSEDNMFVTEQGGCECQHALLHIMSEFYVLQHSHAVCEHLQHHGKEVIPCVARVRSVVACSKASTTVGCLCTQHAKVLRRHGHIHVVRPIQMCKGCQCVTVDAGSTALCAACAPVICGYKHCRAPGSRRSPNGTLCCDTHAPRCNSCTDFATIAQNNKLACNAHCTRCVVCKSAVMQNCNWRRNISLCGDCASHKCLDATCFTIVSDDQNVSHEKHDLLRFCSSHFPRCSDPTCGDKAAFRHGQVFACETHRPKCHTCKTHLQSTAVGRRTVVTGPGHNPSHNPNHSIRFYCKTCTHTAPDCCKDGCVRSASFEHIGILEPALCFIHNYLCIFPECATTATHEFGSRYCTTHTTTINRVCTPQNKDLFKRICIRERFRSLARQVSRTNTIKEELMMVTWHPDRVEKLLNAGIQLDDM